MNQKLREKACRVNARRDPENNIVLHRTIQATDGECSAAQLLHITYPARRLFISFNARLHHTPTRDMHIMIPVPFRRKDGRRRRRRTKGPPARAPKVLPSFCGTVGGEAGTACDRFAMVAATRAAWQGSRYGGDDLSDAHNGGRITRHYP